MNINHMGTSCHLVYRDNKWFKGNARYIGEFPLLLNDLKKATCFLEIREAYIKIKMLPLINDICCYIGSTLINFKSSYKFDNFYKHFF